jgi:DNA-binding LacI/PurR family transcriptional regulator
MVARPTAASPKRRRVTIRDVAAAAGVSISTVSRALRGYADVSPATRERVAGVAAQLGYAPDPAGQTLKLGRTHTVAVLVSGNHGPALLDAFYAEVVGGIEACLEAHDLSLLITRVRTGSAQRRVLQGGRADGVIALGCDLSAPFLEALYRTGTPLVLADSAGWGASGIPSVTVRHEAGGYLATRHLLSGGRRAVAFIAERPGDPNFRRRRRGYERALAEAGALVRPELVAAGMGLEGGYLAAQKLLSRARPDAIFAANDAAAFGALRALAEHGLRVPDDVAVVGFDDLELSRYATPPLSSLRVPRQQLGFLAASSLLQLLGGEVPASFELPVSLVVRESSRPL